MARRSYPPAKVYGLLEPGPVALLTTAGKAGPNVMTMSWLTMMEFEPPLIGCVVSGRNFSFEALRKTKQGVIAIPTVELADQVVAVGNCSGCEVDKFAEFDLTPLPAEQVAAPLVKECYANLECRVADGRLVNQYNFFILDVLKAWVGTAWKDPRTLHHRGKGRFFVAGETVKLKPKAK
ncbi:MAG: flavin reductase family protein [Hydrogenophilaceae bacterium]|nr:flavin reductase family protein [Hydrogenophilaceae bacterium]